MLLRRFAQNDKGNVAMMFGLAMVPMVGMVGAAVDYSRASSVRTQLQVALDSAALMLSKEAANLSSAQLNTKALQYVTAQLNRPEAEALKVNAAYTANPSSIKVTGSASLKTDFMRLIGMPKMDVSTASTVSWGSTKLRVAVALDNTGSMNQSGKIGALKTATKELLNILKDAAKIPGDVQVSIVPFSKDVNVGKSNYKARWIDWTAWDAANGSWCDKKKNGSCDDVQDKKDSWVPADHATWNGCVTDRDKDYDVTNTPPNSKSRFPAEQYSSCPAELMPLSTNWTQLSALVDSMVANGTTNQPIGLAWAWQTLSPGAPFNTPPPPKDTQQAIILLSDGLNTQNRWDGNGSDVAPAVDDRMAKICANVKAANIEIYTVQVNTGGDPTSVVLRNCASKSENFYELKTSGSMVGAFNQIGTKLAKLRISK